MQGLMVEEVHSDDGTCCTAEDRGNKEQLFGDTPVPFCAKRLSIPNNANASTLIIMMYFMTFAPPFRKPGSSLYAAATARIISLYVDIGEVDTS